MILDLRLPKVDGLEVLRRVKSDPALRRMPVVALTTSSSESDVSKAYDLCVNGYVVKPVSFGQFAQVLRGVSEFWVATNRYPPRRDQL
jgi:CheY-like chemotaxis protein